MPFLLMLAAVLSWGCAPGPAAPLATQGVPDSTLLGQFRDDYGEAYIITRSLWTQLPRSRYRIVAWNPGQRYLIAQNDSANPSAPGLWTRIDWVPLSGMAPYSWAYCLSAYEAPTRAVAESTSVAKRDTPRTGCNGYPFSRMRRPDPGEPRKPSSY